MCCTHVDIGAFFVDREGFIIQAPLRNELGVVVFLGPNTPRSCINIMATSDDNPDQNRVNLVQFTIEIFEELHLLVSPSAQVVTVHILDDDCKCN